MSSVMIMMVHACATGQLDECSSTARQPVEILV